MADESEAHPSPTSITIKTDWSEEAVRNVPTFYANQLLITHSGPEFFLVFGVVTPPITPPTGEAEIEQMDALPVSPLLKIAVSPEAMLMMAGAIQSNVESYMETKETRDKEAFSRE